MNKSLQQHKRRAKSQNKANSLRNQATKSWSLDDPFPRSLIMQPDNKVYEYVQTTENPAWLISSTLSVATAAYSPAAAALPDWTSFSGLYDQYRITEIEVWLYPRQRTNTTASTNHGILHSVVDYDDANSVVTASDALSYANCLTTGGDQGHYRRFKPRVALAAYSGAFTSYANQKDQWIDVASSGVLYYGVKWLLTATDIVYTYDLITKYRVQFRNVR